MPPAPSAPAAPRPARAPWPGLAAAAAVAVAAWLAYGPALDGGFTWDDETSIRSHWILRDPGAALRALAPPGLLGPGRPVTDATYAFDLWRGGLAPGPFHRTSLLLHLAAGALVFLLLRGALRAAGHARAAPLAGLAAAAFVLHPLQSEAVAYLAQRSEVLAALLAVAALLALLRADAAWPRRAAWGWLGAAAAAQALALGAKPVAAVVPAAYLLHRAVLGGGTAGAPPLRARALRALALGAPAWALSLAAALRSLGALTPGAHAGGGPGLLSPLAYLATQWRVGWLYARLAAWPAGLNLDHDVAPSAGPSDPAALAAGAALLAALAGALWLWRRAEAGRAGPAARAAAFGLLWWWLWLLPTGSLLPLLDLAAEHRAYLALAGLLLAAAAGLDAACARWLPARAAPRAALAAGARGAAALALALHARAGDWSSPVALWEDAAAKSPRKARVLLNLAHARQEAGQAAQAAATYQRAAALPATAEERVALARNLAALLTHDLGDAPGALAVLAPALALVPGHPELLRNRAEALYALGRHDEAWRDAQAALARAPGAPELHDLAGMILVATGRMAEAEPAFREAARIDPADPGYQEHHFLALFHLGRRAEACAAWRALRQRGHPGSPDGRRRAAEAGCGP
jgi:tetratricopeptide (TPR) repeat protein